jgi:hypothetical protein
MVSSSMKLCYFLRILTLHSRLRPRPTASTFGSWYPLSPDTVPRYIIRFLSLPPSLPLRDLHCEFISPAHARRFVFVAPCWSASCLVYVSLVEFFSNLSTPWIASDVRSSGLVIWFSVSRLAQWAPRKSGRCLEETQPRATGGIGAASKG